MPIKSFPLSNTPSASPVYTQLGTCDQNGIQSIKNARAAGVSYVDGYIYPRTAMDPAKQIDAMLNCLNSAGAKFGMIWLDVEPDRMWSSNHQTNINFIKGLAQALDRRGVKYGVYTNANGWNQITGGWTGFSHLPLWWAYWDGSPSFSKWSSFGGWKRPAMKQYKGDTTLCGASVDLNFW